MLCRFHSFLSRYSRFTIRYPKRKHFLKTILRFLNEGNLTIGNSYLRMVQSSVDMGYTILFY